MLSNKKGLKGKVGFTLIELLAIIVILAIIALITVPIILDVIDNAKKGSVVDSAYGYKNAIQDFYVQQLSINSDFKLNGTYIVNDGVLGTYDIQLSGVKPQVGFLKYRNNILENGCLVFDDYRVMIENGSVNKSEKGQCEIPFVFDKNTTYVLGQEVKNYGGYNWHVIGDDGVNVTLLMDTGDNGSYKLPSDTNLIKDGSYKVSTMKHYTSSSDVDGSYYKYSWNKSFISKYLNKEDKIGDFLYDLRKNIDNVIVPVAVCNDPSRGDDVITYGGYLASQIPSDASESVNCSGNISDYYVRLITKVEYDLIVGDASIIGKNSWFFTTYGWWTMGASYSSDVSNVSSVYLVVKRVGWANSGVSIDGDIRPVITISK